MQRELAVVLFAVLSCVASCASGNKVVTSLPAAAKPPQQAGAAPALQFAKRSSAAASDPVLDTAREELDRALAALEKAPDGKPYFLAYQISHRKTLRMQAQFGALVTSEADESRTLDVDLRLGSYALDSTHAVRGHVASRAYGGGMNLGGRLPLDGSRDALRVALWMATDREYKRAAARFAQIKAERVVRVEEEDRSDDFSREPPREHLEPVASLDLDRAEWENRLRELSALFREHGAIHRGGAALTAEVVTRHLVSSEGSRVRTSQPYLRLIVTAQTRADDGMELELHETFAASTAAGLPSQQVLAAAVRTLSERLLALRAAPVAEPYVGPAILEGDAASVFFHEVFGHRAEGHRQKDESEGQTFAKKIGTQIMPAFVDVYDDPTASALGTTELLGHYVVDDEAVASRRVELVDDGVLRTFLMSRSPARGIAHSNGHGRRQEGRDVVARQGNLIVHPTRTESPASLRARLLDEVRGQGKPYGLLIKRVTGGFTMTQRYGPQAFKVEPVLVSRLYEDGREELIRGVDLEGTPLTALSKIVAAGDDYTVFNGTCGAESGWVPVSAVSPSILIGQVEVARKEKSQDRPPLLAAPATSPEKLP